MPAPYSITRDELAQVLAGEPAYRVGQVWDGLHVRVQRPQEMTELPGAPDGHYVLLQFETVFANKKSTIETVTFMLEKDGKWKAAGYYIK